MTSISLFAVSVALVGMSAPGFVSNEPFGADQDIPRAAVTRECSDVETIDAVRARDAAADQLLQFGAERSPTFRSLLEDLRLSDVIVYVQVKLDAESTRGGSLKFIGSGGAFRWVMATVNTGSSRLASFQENLVALTAILGHELQHAREVSTALSIRTAADFDIHFRTVGISVDRDAVDTDAARHVGRVVEEELRGRLKKTL